MRFVTFKMFAMDLFCAQDPKLSMKQFQNTFSYSMADFVGAFAGLLGLTQSGSPSLVHMASSLVERSKVSRNLLIIDPVRVDAHSNVGHPQVLA